MPSHEHAGTCAMQAMSDDNNDDDNEAITVIVTHVQLAHPCPLLTI